MTTAVIVVSAALLIWFFGCIVTYRLRGALLVEGMSVKSYEFLMLCLFTAGFGFFLALPDIGEWALLAVLLFWAVVQFFCHWYYTIFGASEKKLRGYNECFKDTIRIFKASDKRVIPDLYHIVLHILIFSDLVLTAICCFGAKTAL